MFNIWIPIAAVAGLLTLTWSASAEDEGPKEAKTTAEIVKAVEKIHLGTAIGGKPDEVSTAEFSSGDIKMFVAWHNPFSGVKGCCAYLYVLDGPKKVWTRQMAKVFHGTNDVSVEFGDKFIYTVKFRDESGKVIYKHSLRAQAVDPDEIKDKVSIKLGEKFDITFDREGNQLTNPSKFKQAEAKKLSVKVQLGVTTDAPFPPPREGATRPYLTVENNFDKTLHFRALIRMKGSKEFFEIDEDMKPIPAGDIFNKCWEFDSSVEEVVLCEFKLSDKRAK